MCGIYGIHNRLSGVDLDTLISRRDMFSYRGPDSSGAWLSVDRSVGFAHRRLSVIDLSENGHQPMQLDGFSIVFNGEVYNYKSIRDELLRCGYVFRGNSDTEVVLAAYKEWGEDCLGKFNGMFALAIYDPGRHHPGPSIFLARDRVGEKPLYYSHGATTFRFSSELKALALDGDVDPIAVNSYLALGFIPSNQCLIKGIEKLPAAYAGRYTLGDGAFKAWRYWGLPDSVVGSPDIEELTTELDCLLTDSVRLRMVSDVPMGVLLSGGMDSSLVAAYAAKSSPSPIRTFTIAFPGTKYDESSYADVVSKHFGTQHHNLPVKELAPALLLEIASFIDEPIADSSIIPTYLVSRLTRRHVTVALGGDGGDELFGGYPEYSKAILNSRVLSHIPEVVVKGAAMLASTLPAGVYGRSLVSSFRGGAFQRLIWGTPYFDHSLRRTMFTSQFLSAVGDSIVQPELLLLAAMRTSSDPVDGMMRAHYSYALTDDFLVKIDRASMYNSLETRAPYLDHRLISFAFGKIPSTLKATANQTRIIQRKLCERMLPVELDLNRKQGFSIPINEWLRNDDCAVLRQFLPEISDYISKAQVERLIRGHNRGRANGGRLFSLFMLGAALSNLKRWRA